MADQATSRIQRTLEASQLWRPRMILFYFTDLTLRVGVHREDDTFLLPLTNLSSLEMRFITKGWVIISEELRKYPCVAQLSWGLKGLHLQFKYAHRAPVQAQGEKTMSDHSNDNSNNSKSNMSALECLKMLLTELETSFDCVQASLDYGDLVKVFVDAHSAAVSLLVPDLFSEPVDVQVLPNVPIGGDMVPYDMCFETAPSHGRISYPDYHILSDAHHDYYFHEASIRRYIHSKHFTYLAEVITCLPHEMIHIYQGVAKQRDSSHAKWSAEHDASFVPQSLLYAVAFDPELSAKSEAIAAASKLLADGVWELVALHTKRLDHALLQDITANSLSEYLKLKDSFGTYEPQVPADDTYAATLFKGKLSRDHFQDGSTQAAHQLRTLFRKERQNVDTFTTGVPDYTAPPSPVWYCRSPCIAQEIVEFCQLL